MNLIDLKVVNFESGALLEEFLTTFSIDLSQRPDVFIMKTCQRGLIITFNPHYLDLAIPFGGTVFEGARAHSFILEVICGLQSQILGENEILGQFKISYEEYRSRALTNGHLLRSVEKLIQDAKGIRTHHLAQVGQQSYAGISRRILTEKAKNYRGKPPVLILGSGQLAKDCIKLLSKSFDVYLCARNQEKLCELQEQYTVQLIEWDDLSKRAIIFPFIVNTIGRHTVLLSDSFFTPWSKANQDKCFIDLGSPSAILSKLKASEGLYRLNDIFQKGVLLDGDKKQKLAQAQDAIKQRVAHRGETTALSFPFGWEDLSFAFTS